MPKSYSSDVAFTPSVKAAQERRGSRAIYHRMEESGGWETTISPALTDFIAARDSFYFATANAEGQPYIQHRGGPKGFLRVLDPKTLGFVDFAGNKQYISLGNLAENNRAFLFLMDYEGQQRIKIWGRARVVEGDAALMAKLMPPGTEARTKARAERVILFDVAAWDSNCPQHIPQKIDIGDVRERVGKLESRIAALEAENAELRAATVKRSDLTPTGKT